MIAFRHTINLILTISFVTLSIHLTGCKSSDSSMRTPTSLPAERPKDSSTKGKKRDTSDRKYQIDDVARLVAETKGWIGTPYQYGGHSKKGTDCSGMIMEVFRSALNEKIPRSSRDQHKACRKIKKENLMPGDLVFFATGRDPARVSHVGLYIGKGDIIHASSSKGVMVSSIYEKYFLKHYHSSGRTPYVDKLYASAKRDNTEVTLPQFTDGPIIITTPVNDTRTGVPSIKASELDKLFNSNADAATDTLANKYQNEPNNHQGDVPLPANFEPIDTISFLFFD